MIQLRKIDENGLFIEDVITDETPYVMEVVQEEVTDEEGNVTVVNVERPVLDDNDQPTPDPLYVSEPVPQGFYHPKWNGSEWVEGMSQEQIDELKNQPVEPSPEERIEFLEQDNAYLFYDSMAKENRINDLETMNAELTYLIMTGGL